MLWSYLPSPNPNNTTYRLRRVEKNTANHNAQYMKIETIISTVDMLMSQLSGAELSLSIHH